MDPGNEEGVLSILRGRKGCDDKYASISEFIEDLGEEVEELAHKWGSYVLSEKHQQQQQQISTLLLLEFQSKVYCLGSYLMQFWGVEEVEGSHHSLSTKHYPFCVGNPSKGICWYRKLFRNHVYDVDVEGGDDDYEEQLGGVGRAFRNKQPESTPDLRLYSTHQFPMRDQAARCGFKEYTALPIFDSHTNHCYGVLEVLAEDDFELLEYVLPTLDTALENAGLKSTHRPVSTSDFRKKWLQLPEIEIREMLELAVATVPRLYLVTVWVPSRQCTTNSCCMELAFFIISPENKFNSYNLCDYKMARYIKACALHKLHLYHHCFSSSNLGDMSISKNPLAHYAQRARISHPFAVSLQSWKDSNHSYLIQFFVQPKFREDGYGDNSLLLLLRIIKMNLKSFNFELLGQFLEECKKPNAIEFESIDSLEVIESYKLWESKDSELGERLLVHTPIKKKIENFMQKLKNYFCGREKYWIVQFWAPEMMENRCYLETSDQPYAVAFLTKGLASFREKCRTHHYVVDDEAKEEELGPPGRVYKNRHPEITPDLFHYSTKEFPIRNYAMHCCSRPYFALPIFDDQHNHMCVGVLEFLGFTDYHLQKILKELEEVKLSSSPTCFHPRLLADEEPDNSINCRREALKEVEDTLRLICDDIPQYYMANVWVPNEKCVIGTDGNMICMELAYTHQKRGYWDGTGMKNVSLLHTRKGVIEMVQESENKSCFCRNLSKFSIVDQPLSHFAMRERCDACFAICLQSSYTGDLVYILEFFLCPGPASYEYLRSFLNLLLPTLKLKLKSFKLACGKQLGEELVVEVIEFSEENKLGPSETEQSDVFPIKFKSVQFTQERNQHIEEHIVEEQQIEEHIVVERQTEEHIFEEQLTEEHIFEERQTEEHIFEEQLTEEQIFEEQHIFEEQQTEEHTNVASDLKRREGGKRKTGLHLNLEILRPHFGKKLKDVSEELGVGRSTIKRACREYGINRWPSQEKYKNNPSLFEREMQPSTSNLQPVDKITESSDHVVAEEEAEKVIVKVRYEEDIIKFDSCVPLRLATLIEEVDTRLNLEKDGFKLKYLDEDGDEILLLVDKDLQHCPKSRTATGKTCIQLLVR